MSVFDRSLLVFEPNERLSATQALGHPFIPQVLSSVVTSPQKIITTTLVQPNHPSLMNPTTLITDHNNNAMDTGQDNSETAVVPDETERIGVVGKRRSQSSDTSPRR